jgi:hypothetical protein
MSINFQEILKELEYRVEHGIIDLTKEEQVTKLVEILRENGVSDANEMAQKARVYYSYLDEAKQSLDKVLKQKFINPDTDREVTVASALGYKKNSNAYLKAKGMMSTAGYSEKDIDMVDAGPDDEEKPVKPKSNVFGKDKGGKVFEPNTVTVTDDKQKSDKVHSTLYPSDKIQKGKVMGESNEGDNQVKNDMLKHGFGGYQKATKKKPAPGSAGSAFNEIVSGEGVKILEKYPDLSETELARVMVKQFCGTKLGKEQSPSTDVMRSLPADLKNNACASKALISARSAKDKYDKANNTKQDLQQKGLLSKNTKITPFYGADDSKSAQIEMVKKAKTIMLPDGTMVRRDDAIAFVAAGGGVTNPSDTAVFIQDDKGNLVMKFYSDKTSPADIQDNSTLSQEITDKVSQIDSLEQNKIINKKQAAAAKGIIATHAKGIQIIEESYSEGNKFVAQTFIKGGTGYDLKEQVKILNNSESISDKNWSEAVMDKKGIKKEIIENLPKGCNPNNPTKECQYASLLKVVASGSGTNAQQKIIMKISGILTDNFINAEKEIPEGIDVNSIVSVQRKKVADSYHKMFRNLDEIVVKVGNTKKGLGTYTQSEDVIDSLHLTLMDSPPNKYVPGNPNSMMGQAFEASMGGVMVNGQLLRECLGVQNTQEFKEKFSVKETQENTYEFSEKEAMVKLQTMGISKPTKKQLQNARNVTGMKILSYAVDKKTGQQQEVGYRTYRGKAGKTSKTSTTMQYSPQMQNCFKSKSNKK